jgi:hypothetical protein
VAAHGRRSTASGSTTKGLAGRWPERLTFQVDADLVQRLDACAEQHQTNRPTIIRQALVQYLDAMEGAPARR